MDSKKERKKERNGLKERKKFEEKSEKELKER